MRLRSLQQDSCRSSARRFTVSARNTSTVVRTLSTSMSSDQSLKGPMVQDGRVSGHRDFRRRHHGQHLNRGRIAPLPARAVASATIFRRAAGDPPARRQAFRSIASSCDRLRYEAVHAGVLGAKQSLTSSAKALAVSAMIGRRSQSPPSARIARVASSPSHFGHAHVHEHDIESPGRSLLKRQTAVRRNRDLDVELCLEQLGEHHLVGGIVLSQQDLQRPPDGGQYARQFISRAPMRLRARQAPTYRQPAA